MSALDNTRRLRDLFSEEAANFDLRGVLGVTMYQPVFEALMPVQKERLMEITGDRHPELLEDGFFVSFAYAYPDGIVDNIGFSKEGVFDKETWNIYAAWYKRLNEALNKTSKRLAESVNGIPLSATSEGRSSKIRSVNEYYPTVVSHRVHAELSGIGWRGKNSLIINSVYSCMIRLAGVITSQPLETTPRLGIDCGECTSCLDVCTFLKHRDKLDDYRQQCLAYMNWLDLDDEVCGKCIKACVYSLKFGAEKKP